jgi:hypothetical protein
MDMLRCLKFLFALLISAGLVIAPVSLPAAGARASSDQGMQMADMSADMPCCPEKQQQSNCQDCPFLAICMAKALQNEPSANGLPVHEATSRTLRPLDEPAVAGLVRPPPDQPPRNIV